MRLEVNGEIRELEAATVRDALHVLGWEGVRVATALNGTFVPVGLRAGTVLAPGDRLEVLTAMQGG